MLTSGRVGPVPVGTPTEEESPAGGTYRSASVEIIPVRHRSTSRRRLGNLTTGGKR